MPARPTLTVESVTAFEDYLVVEERERGLSRIRIQNFTGGDTHYIEFPEPVYTAGLRSNAEYDTKILRFNLYLAGNAKLRFRLQHGDARTGTEETTDRAGGYDSSSYSPSEFTRNRSGRRESAGFLVYRKGLVRDGKAPMLLYGYGSYGISMDPSFSSDRLSLLDRGCFYSRSRIFAEAANSASRGTRTGACSRRRIRSRISSPAPRLDRGRYTSPGRLRSWAAARGAC